MIIYDDHISWSCGTEPKQDMGQDQGGDRTRKWDCDMKHGIRTKHMMRYDGNNHQRMEKNMLQYFWDHPKMIPRWSKNNLQVIFKWPRATATCSIQETKTVYDKIGEPRRNRGLGETVAMATPPKNLQNHGIQIRILQTVIIWIWSVLTIPMLMPLLHWRCYACLIEGLHNMSASLLLGFIGVVCVF